MSRTRILRRLLGDTRAAAMVEFAIIAPLLFILIFGIIDFGRYFFDYNHLTNAAREGARWGAVLPSNTATAVTEIRTRVKNRIGGARIQDNMITVCFVSLGCTETVRVTITGYPFSGMAPLIPLPGTLPVVRSEFRHEFR